MPLFRPFQDRITFVIRLTLRSARRENADELIVGTLKCLESGMNADVVGFDSIRDAILREIGRKRRRPEDQEQ